MESNDRLNWQDDKEIEKIIPFDKGIKFNRLHYRTTTFQWCGAKDQQMELEKRAHSVVDYQKHLLVQEEA
jgi:hypothetical protein